MEILRFIAEYGLYDASWVITPILLLQGMENLNIQANREKDWAVTERSYSMASQPSTGECHFS